MTKKQREVIAVLKALDVSPDDMLQLLIEQCLAAEQKVTSAEAFDTFRVRDHLERAHCFTSVKLEWED